MQAMIFAAGLGTRLRPYINSVPKPLVAIESIPMLERIINNFIRAGVEKIVINTHHLAEQISDFVRAKNFPVPIKLSHEPVLLETAGGLANARPFFDTAAPILIHNCDVYTDLDLIKFYQTHRPGDLGTLAVFANSADPRPFLIDQDGLLAGHRNKLTGTETIPGLIREGLRPVTNCGIYIITQEFLDFLGQTESAGVSITQIFLSAVKQGLKLRTYDIGQTLWYDIGAPGDITKLQARLQPHAKDRLVNS